MIAKAALEALLQKLPDLDARAQEQVWQSVQAEIDARCREDGLFWLRFVKTRDEADPVQATKPFPVDLLYIQAIWEQYLIENRVALAKSRQMKVSWETCSFCCWWARYKPNQAIYWQTKGWQDAVAMVCMPTGGFAGRCQFIEDNLPSWMQVAYKGSEGRMQYPNGSLIQALSGGADQVRSKTASLIVEDEFAHQEDQEGVYTAVAPLIQKGAKGFFISSPNGTNNMFATLYHGRPVGSELVTG